LNHPTRNPSPKRFLYKPQHFDLLLATPVCCYASLFVTRYSPLQFTTSVLQVLHREFQDHLAALEVQPPSNSKSQHIFIYLINPRISPDLAMVFLTDFSVTI